ncbi:MAG: isoprenylcysteine carboxylmethyltransferase family protein [Phenylobacterium sp.]
MRILKSLLASLSFVAVLALLLLVPAGLAPGGTWAWPRAWGFLAGYGGAAIVGYAALAALRPASFDVRMQGLVARKAKKQPLIDAVGGVIFTLYLAAWMAFIPLDVFWLRLLPAPPPPVAALGAAVSMTGVAIAFLAVAQNQFAAPTVQSEADQTVIDTGLYGVIRHPLYTGNLLSFAGMAVWLGSYAALAGVVGIALFTVARMAVEEAYLRENLPGYVDYARRVRSRLIPYVL